MVYTVEDDKGDTVGTYKQANARDEDRYGADGKQPPPAQSRSHQRRQKDFKQGTTPPQHLNRDQNRDDIMFYF